MLGCVYSTGYVRVVKCYVVSFSLRCFGRNYDCESKYNFILITVKLKVAERSTVTSSNLALSQGIIYGYSFKLMIDENKI